MTSISQPQERGVLFWMASHVISRLGNLHAHSLASETQIQPTHNMSLAQRDMCIQYMLEWGSRIWTCPF